MMFAILVGSCVYFLSNVIGYANESDSVGFSVSPNYNGVQNKESSFFDLTITPDSKQTIGITVTNTSKDLSKYKIQVIQASTNKNGVIDYTDSKGELTNGPFRFDKQITYEKELQLSAGQSKEVPIQIAVPTNPFKGEVLGGINVTKEIAKETTQQQLVNQYSYVVGLRLRESLENPERNLTAGEVKPIVSFGKSGISMPIINDQANAMGQLTVTSVLKRDGKEIKKATYKHREIAPNSIYPYSLSWDKQDYVPGKYQLTITVMDAQAHKWSFYKEFNLKPEEVSKIKEAAIHPPKEDYRWIWLIVGVFAIIILVLLIYIFKNKKERGTKESD